MVLPIWTSTKNAEDIETENDFIDSNKGLLKRIEVAQLNDAKVDEFSLSETFDGVFSEIKVPKIWIEKHVPRLVEIANSSLDLRLKNIMLDFNGHIFSTYVMTTDRVMRAKIDLTIDQDTAAKEAVPFKIIVSAESLMALHMFISKAFDCGPCSIGAKGSADAEMCESVLVNAYGKELNNAHPVAKAPHDDMEKPAEEAYTKMALVKLPRSIGLLPFNAVNPPAEMHQMYSATIKPTLRWAFSNKQDYIELVSNGGILEVQFKNSDDKSTARASLGARIDTESNLPDSHATALACLDAKHIHDIFNFSKEPIKLTFGVVEEGGELLPSMLYLQSPEIDAAITQRYSKEDFQNNPTIYVTRIKGKIVESSPEVATERALKQNKGATAKGAIIKTAQMEDPFDMGASVVTEVQAQPVSTQDDISDDAGIPPAKPSEEASVVFVDQAELRELTTSLQPNPGEGIDKTESIDVTPDCGISGPNDDAKEGGEAATNGIEAAAPNDKPLTDDQESSVNSALTKLSVAANSVRRAMLEMSKALLDIEHNVSALLKIKGGFAGSPKKAVYDLDIIIEYLAQYEAAEVKTTQLRENLGHIKDTTIYASLNKLEGRGLLKRIKKGTYLVPEKFKEAAIVVFPRKRLQSFEE